MAKDVKEISTTVDDSTCDGCGAKLPEKELTSLYTLKRRPSESYNSYDCQYHHMPVADLCRTCFDRIPKAKQ